MNDNINEPIIVQCLSEALELWLPGTETESIAVITPDASTRRYFRLTPRYSKTADLGQLRPKTVVAMVYDSVQSPEHEGRNALPSDQCYLQLTEFFLSHGIRVPEIYWNSVKTAEISEQKPIFLIEDLGDLMLADILLDQNSSSHSSDKKELARHFQAAIDQIALIQKIPADQSQSIVAFQRGFAAPQYINEMREFSDFLIAPLDSSATTRELLENTYAVIANYLQELPRVLSHRDFHPWNLIIDGSGELRVIDFQDALLATECYDLVGLLNDRDVDSALGRELYLQLVNYFYQQKQCPVDFFANYQLALLQRDLKVAGRFAKLSQVRGLLQYQRWIPGTVSRVGRNMVALVNSDSIGSEEISAVLETCAKLLPDLARGAKDPLIFSQ